ncbi:MAG: hypothetical protein ACREBU_06940 [Nitrososphaera sp.]
MTIIRLVCPQCRNQDAYEERNLDASKEITCSACGFSELPTTFELAKGYEKKSWLFAKIIIILLAGIAFSLVGFSVIALAAFFVPVIIAAVIFIILYRRWKEKKAS